MTDVVFGHAHRARVRSLGRTLLSIAAAALLTVASAQLSVGEGHIDEGRFAEAVETFQRLIDGNPNNVRAQILFARASVYWADSLPSGESAAKEDLFAKAAAAAEKAVELAPNDADAHFEVARALGRLAQFRGVLQSLNLAGRVSAALDAALAANPNHGPSWHARALFHRDVPWIAGGRSSRVIPSFQSAIAAEPDAITHRVELARAYLAAGEVALAREQLDVALSLTARTYLQRQDLDEARALQRSLP